MQNGITYLPVATVNTLEAPKKARFSDTFLESITNRTMSESLMTLKTLERKRKKMHDNIEMQFYLCML